ncbi:MAG: class I SAM-dependent methyltransferase [Candidatus Dormibacteria bacterium]
MPRDRDVHAFDVRAPGYESGRLGALHREIADRTVALALSSAPTARRVLDVGCGTGYLLRELARRLPDATRLDGVDPAPSMVEVAWTLATTDARLHFAQGFAEALPHPAASFDLVVSTTSFDHWEDQQAGLRQCARVLVPGGRLVLTDIFSLLLTPTLVAGHRGRARTVRGAARMLKTAGFEAIRWHRVGAILLRAVSASTPTGARDAPTGACS